MVEAGEARVVGEVGAVDLVPVQVDQVPGRVGHLVPVPRDVAVPAPSAGRCTGARTGPGAGVPPGSSGSTSGAAVWLGLVCPYFTPGRWRRSVALAQCTARPT